MKKTAIIKNKSTEKDIKLSFYIALFFIISALNSTIKNIFPISNNIWKLISLSLGGVLFLYFISISRIILRRSSKTFFVSLILIFLIYLLSAVIFYTNLNLISNYLVWTLIGFSLGICAYSINNYLILHNILIKYSWLITFILSLIIFFPNKQINEEYNMFFSYAMGLPLLLHLNVFIDSKKNLYLFVAIYEFILILLFGSRGIILAIILFILFKFIEADLSPLKKILYSFIGIVLLLAFSINFNKIGQGIISFLDSKGLYSRTLTLFFRDNNLLHLSDRDYIWKKCIELINEKPTLGWGVAGEVEPLERKLGLIAVQTYPHNIALEMMLNFGVIIGIILFLLVLLSIIKILKDNNDQNHKNLMILFYCLGFVPLLMSGTYLKSPEFFILIFLLLASFNKNKTPQYESLYSK